MRRCKRKKKRNFRMHTNWICSYQLLTNGFHSSNKSCSLVCVRHPLMRNHWPKKLYSVFGCSLWALNLTVNIWSKIKSATLLTKGFDKIKLREIYRFLSLFTNSTTVDWTSGIFLIWNHWTKWENAKLEVSELINPNHAQFAAGEREEPNCGR